MSIFMGLIGFLGIITAIGFLLYSLFAKKKRNKWLKIGGITAGVSFVVFIIGVSAIDSPDAEEAKSEEPKTEASEKDSKETNSEDEEKEEPKKEKEPEPKLTPQEEMLTKLAGLIDEGKAIDTGSYIKGDIPKGEYAFITFDGSGQYYAETDQAGEIIDNENFASFGYVHVHEKGNVETRGALVKMDALKDLGVSGAKELYEVMNDVEDYTGSAWYKVGTDIEPGQYVIESIGEGYAAVMSGPVGNNEIINNNAFSGRYSVNVSDGQYLVVSKGEIKKQ